MKTKNSSPADLCFKNDKKSSSGWRDTKWILEIFRKQWKALDIIKERREKERGRGRGRGKGRRREGEGGREYELEIYIFFFLNSKKNDYLKQKLQHFIVGFAVKTHAL